MIILLHVCSKNLEVRVWLLSNQIKQDLSKAAYGGKLFLALSVSWKGENPTCIYIPDLLYIPHMF